MTRRERVMNRPTVALPLLFAFWLLQILLPARAVSAPLTQAQAQSIAAEAGDFFRRATDEAVRDPAAAQELYSKALLRFEQLVSVGGVRNGQLFYNIGNTYFRMNDIGRAILSYRRAAELIPNDRNLIQNLEYARSRRGDQIREQQSVKVMKLLLFWHYDFSARTRAVVFGVCFVVFWIGLGLRLWRPEISPVWCLWVLGITALLFVGSVIVEQQNEKSRVDGVIVVSEVIARKGNSESYQPSFKEALHAGTELRVLEQRGDWYHAALGDGRDCWLPQNAVELVALP